MVSLKSIVNFLSSRLKISSRSLSFCLSTLLSVVAQSALCATIEVSLDGSVLPSAAITDYADTNLSFLTNEEGRIQYTGGSCASLNYVSEENIIYRALRTCGLDDPNVPVYKINLTKLVTLSGTVEVSQSCNCNLNFVNLDEGSSYGRGTSLLNSTKFEFNEMLPAGRYRIKVSTVNWPSAPDRHYLASIGVDARLHSVSDIKIETASTVDVSRFSKSPPRADLISVRHSETSHLSFIEGAGHWNQQEKPEK